MEANSESRATKQPVVTQSGRVFLEVHCDLPERFSFGEIIHN